jgi:hypothetical protein
MHLDTENKPRAMEELIAQWLVRDYSVVGAWLMRGAECDDKGSILAGTILFFSA